MIFVSSYAAVHVNTQSHTEAKRLPPSQAKKPSGSKSAQAFARGQQKKQIAHWHQLPGRGFPIILDLPSLT